MSALTRAGWPSQRPPGELQQAIKAAGSAGHRSNNKTHISAESKRIIRDRGLDPRLHPRWSRTEQPGSDPGSKEASTQQSHDLSHPSIAHRLEPDYQNIS